MREVKERVASGSIERTIAETVAREVSDSIDGADVAQLLLVTVAEAERRRLTGELWAFEHDGDYRFPR